MLDVGLNAIVLWTLLYVFLVYGYLFESLRYALGFGEPHELLLNPLNWSWSSWAALVAVILSIAWLAKPRFPRDANVYFDEDTLYRLAPVYTSGAARPPLDALVVEAGVLDEALLALSSEPLVYGALVPRLKDLLRAGRGWSPPAPPIGVHHDLDDPLRLRKTFNRAVLALRQLVIWACMPVLWPVRLALEAYLARTITELVSSAASGLRPLDFKGARIDIRSMPHVRFLAEQR